MESVETLGVLSRGPNPLCGKAGRVIPAGDHDCDVLLEMLLPKKQTWPATFAVQHTAPWRRSLIKNIRNISILIVGGRRNSMSGEFKYSNGKRNMEVRSN